MIQPGVPNDNPNDNEPIEKNHTLPIGSSKMSSKRKTWQGSDVSLNDLLELKVDDVKTKLSCETSLKNLSGRCENEAFVSCGGCDSGGGGSGGW